MKLSAAEIAVIALAHTGQQLPESFQTKVAVCRLIELRLIGPTDNNLNCAVCNYITEKSVAEFNFISFHGK